MTLTELSYYSRKSLPFVIVFFLLMLIFFYAIKLLFMYIFSLTPKTVYTNTVFGKIQSPQIREASGSAGYNFTLDTIEGQPIVASDTAKVYFLPPSAAKFGYSEKIYLMAKAFGFDTTLTKYKLNDTEATFNDLKQKLTVDITNFNFRYDYGFDRDTELFKNTTIPVRTVIENKAIDFLKTIGRYPDELSKGKTNVSLRRYDSVTRKFLAAERPVDANVVEIDFFRPDIDQTSVVTPGFPSSQNYVIMVFHQDGYKVIRAQVAFFEKSDEQTGVYPLKTGVAAWQELQSGKGLVVVPKSTKKDITIKTMFIGYLDPDIYQNYLQPVYVFVGENNFVAYVPAVSNDFLTD